MCLFRAHNFFRDWSVLLENSRHKSEEKYFLSSHPPPSHITHPADPIPLDSDATNLLEERRNGTNERKK